MDRRDPDWEGRLLEVIDRSLARAYAIDPSLYVRLLETRNRLVAQLGRS